MFDVLDIISYEVARVKYNILGENIIRLLEFEILNLKKEFTISTIVAKPTLDLRDGNSNDDHAW